MIGLSGLITPSLDEMVTVAGEMQRLGLKTPLLIGGATTSKAHTALRIDPAYEGPVIHVLDASRAVGVASSLVSDTQCEPLIAKTADEYEALRIARSRSGQSELATLEEARANGFAFDPSGQAPPPVRPGLHQIGEWPLRDLKASIDWTPFFRAWELAGNYPADPRRQGRRRKRPEPVQRRQCDARPDHRRALGHSEGDRRPVAMQARGRRRPRSRRERLDPPALPSPAGEEARGPAEHEPRRLHQSRRRGLDRRLRGRNPRARTASRAVQGAERRLFGHPAEGARRPPRGKLRRGPACRSPQAPVGLCRRASLERAADPREISRASVRRRAIRPAPITASSRSCSTCSAAIRAKSR